MEKRTGSLMMEYQTVKRAQILYYVNYVKKTFLKFQVMHIEWFL